MFRTAALLIALALVGSPIGKAVCDVWCLTDGGAIEHSACHDAHEGSGPSVKGLTDPCDSLIVAGPFVPERVQRPSGGASVAAVASAPLLVAHPMHRATLLRRDPNRPRAGTLRSLRI
jgi:hypothetical protein